MSAMIVPRPESHDFYTRALDILAAAKVDFMVGGAFALGVLAGIHRDTKDFDLMLRPRDVERALQACRNVGFPAEIAYSHWIAKVYCGDHFIDLIYRAGNGLGEVDDAWFEHALSSVVIDRQVLVCPAEELIWQKAFIMERERFDGADIQHILRLQAPKLDWKRLLRRFGTDWRVLLSHLVLFGYIYPDQRDQLPKWVMDDLFTRARDEAAAPANAEPSSEPATPLCRGPLLSRAQYLPDLTQWGFRDIRRDPRVAMTDEEIGKWTSAIDQKSR